jgi:hypothetical protein
VEIGIKLYKHEKQKMRSNYEIRLAFFIIINALTLEAFAYTDELTSSEIGATLSYYQYGEPDVMSLKGANAGIDYIGTLGLTRYWFVRGDIIGAAGGARYKSYKSGSANGERNLYIDTRALCGTNIEFEKFALAPYTGIGYRYLYNKGQGSTDTGYNTDIRRESNYLYVPVGLIHKFNLTDQAKLVTTIEFDSLILGRQITHLSDGGYPYKDITNKQDSGYGSRLSFMYQQDNWSVGPYVNYWHISKSDAVYAPDKKDGGGVVTSPWFEPKNYTIEAGLRISYRF